MAVLFFTLLAHAQQEAREFVTPPVQEFGADEFGALQVIGAIRESGVSLALERRPAHFALWLPIRQDFRTEINDSIALVNRRALGRLDDIIAPDGL